MTNPAKKMVFDFWKDLPQVICTKCEKVYRMNEVENFVCTDCLQQSEMLKKQKELRAIMYPFVKTSK